MNATKYTQGKVSARDWNYTCMYELINIMITINLFTFLLTKKKTNQINNLDKKQYLLYK